MGAYLSCQQITRHACISESAGAVETESEGGERWTYPINVFRQIKRIPSLIDRLGE